MSGTSVCAYLRTKNAYGELEGAGSGWAEAPETSDCYWCVRTGWTWGPDGGLAVIGACRAGRTCYEPRDPVAGDGEQVVAAREPPDRGGSGG